MLRCRLCRWRGTYRAAALVSPDGAAPTEVRFASVASIAWAAESCGQEGGGLQPRQADPRAAYCFASGGKRGRWSSQARPTTTGMIRGVKYSTYAG